jgi:four helix bundle protein
MKYKDLEIWALARELTIEIHSMTLSDLPRFEMYEVGSQIRRSIKTVKSNIVEGYGRRRYKMDFIHFLIYAESSTDETIDHLETLSETGSLKSENKFKDLHERLEILAKKINRFISSVQQNHRT